MSEPHFAIEPTEDEVAAIAAVLFAKTPESIQQLDVKMSRWALAGKLESVNKWEQPRELSRLKNLRERV